MSTPELLLLVSVVGFTAAAAVLDYRTHRLPNPLTMTILGAGLLFHAVTGLLAGGLAGAGWSLLYSLGGFAAGFGVLLVLWLVGGGGGGDVKFMGALGAWLGPMMTLHVFVVSAVLVAVVMVGYVVYATLTGNLKRARKQLSARGLAEKQKKQPGRVVPYGVPVAFATWSVLAFHWLMESPWMK